MAGYIGPNNRRYEKKRWFVFAAIGAAFVAIAGWIKKRKAT